MELRQIRYVLAVAKEGSFTRASQRLNVSQSAISEQVKLLEGRLGFPLLVRTGRGAEMTDLSDSGLGLIKRKILEKTNRTIGRTLIQETRMKNPTYHMPVSNTRPSTI